METGRKSGGGVRTEQSREKKVCEWVGEGGAVAADDTRGGTQKGLHRVSAPRTEEDVH